MGSSSKNGLPFPTLSETLKRIRIGPNQKLLEPYLAAAIVICAGGYVSHLIRLHTRAKGVAFFGVIASLITAYVIFKVSKRILMRRAAEAFEKKLLDVYTPFVRFLNQCGFGSAGRYLVDILAMSPVSRDSRPQFFVLIDEMLCFLLKALHRIGNEKMGIGKEQDLEQQVQDFEYQLRYSEFQSDDNHLQKLKSDLAVLQIKLARIEALNEIAYVLTKEIRRLREETWELKTKVREKYDARRHAAFIRVKQKREEEIENALRQLNLNEPIPIHRRLK